MLSVKRDLNWQPRDTVRLIFHAFKEFQYAEADAVKRVMSELGDYNMEYAFVHVAQDHPFLFFDTDKNGTGIYNKGAYAPSRGQYVALSWRQTLVSLTGGKELKQASDGLPAPVQLILHRDSTFKDMTYIAKQVVNFAAHSWRGFHPSPMPVTVSYSQLVAKMLGQLANVDCWSPDAILNRIGTTRCLEPTGLEAAFACWVCSSLPNQVARLPPTFSVTDYHQVAQLGYLCSIDITHLASRKDVLEDGLTRLAGRPAIMTGGMHAGFATDAVALLGLALATRFVREEVRDSIRTWMQGFVANACNSLPSWKKHLAYSALHVLDSHPLGLTLLDQDLHSDLRIALFQLGVWPQIFDKDPEQATQALCSGTIMELDIEAPVAAMRLSALDWVLANAPRLSLRQPTIAEVIVLLNSLPAALRRWTWEDAPRTRTGTAQKWDVQNEYHVQNLLYFLLAPIFPDLEDEFYLNPIGQKNPRADLGIPSLQLIIEVKYLRPRGSFQDIVEEVAADASLPRERPALYLIMSSKRV
nr:hypothetical protein [Tanacetum cinerariifolium]